MQELLKQLNIDEATATQILTKYNSDIDSKNQEINTIKTTLTQKDNELKEFENAIKNLEKIDHKALKEELEKSKEDFKNLQEKHKTELKDLVINNAIENGLLKNNAINNKAVMPFIDKSLININESGEIIGLAEQIQNLVSNDDTKFLFKEAQQKQEPTNIQGLNINTGGTPGQSKGTPQVNTWGNGQFKISNIPNFEEFSRNFE